MKSHATLTLTFRDVPTAEAVAAAVSPEDGRYIRTHRRGATIRATATAEAPLSLLHTLDDYLACVTVAERTAEAARPPGRTRRRRA